MKSGNRQLLVAVPELNRYAPHSGIGRVFSSLCGSWDEQVRLVSARFDLCHAPILRHFPFGVKAPAGTDLVLAPKLTGAQALRNTRGVPSIVIVHDIGIVDYPGDRRGLDWLTFQNILRGFHGLRRASHIIAVSKFTRERLLNYLPDLENKTSVIPNAVVPAFTNHNGTRGEARSRITQVTGCTLAEPILVYVGTEIPRKNIVLLLEVLKRVKNRHPRVQLLKIGQPGGNNWRSRTLKAVERLDLRLGQDIVFLEDLDDSTLADVYRAADLFISTSLYEGFGLPAIEAMALGTPVVVSNCSAFPETIGKLGRAVEPRLDEFAEAVSEAIAEPCSKDREAERRSYAETFSLSRMADSYLRVMKRVASERRGVGNVFRATGEDCRYEQE